MITGNMLQKCIENGMCITHFFYIYIYIYHFALHVYELFVMSLVQKKGMHYNDHDDFARKGLGG